MDKQIGRQIQAVMEDLGLPAERVAEEARRLGLPWSRATIKGVILGRRRLNLGEFLLLTEVLGRAAGWERPLYPELFLPDDVRFDVGGLVVGGGALQRLFRGLPADLSDVEPVMTPKMIERRLSARRVPDLDVEMLREVAETHGVALDEAMRDAVGEAETKTAARLGTIPEVVAIAARAKWGTSMTMERDRLAQLRDLEGVAALGHLTRELSQKLDDELRGVRIDLLRRLVPDAEPAPLIVAEAEADAARRLSRRTRKLSELVVLSAYDRWGHGLDAELEQRAADLPKIDAPTEKRLLNEMAEELANDD